MVHYHMFSTPYYTILKYAILYNTILYFTILCQYVTLFQYIIGCIIFLLTQTINKYCYLYIIILETILVNAVVLNGFILLLCAVTIVIRLELL